MTGTYGAKHKRLTSCATTGGSDAVCVNILLFTWTN